MYNTDYFAGFNDIRIFYRSWLPQKPKAMVLLVHGAGEHSDRYKHIGEFFLNEDIAVVSPDLRGFGKSEGIRGHVDTFADYLHDLEILIQKIRKDYPAIPLFLFGHSLGGLIVIRYVQQFPDLTNGVILSSPALELRVQIPFLARRLLDTASILTPGLSIQPTRWRKLAEKFPILEPYLPKEKALQQDPLITAEYTARWLTELIKNGMQAIAESALFRFPLLCVYDQKDPIVHPRSIQLFLDSVSIPEKGLISFDEGYHHPWHARYQDKAIDRLMIWLNNQL
ncbi:alpha/beta hydrolase [Gracilibacillus massiliensis]|uniref:alpha/beta hydrolase n=1 Tax=Gracilibacillus massiliensis TaxID=1564956 RepID=UPI00071D8791|nr:alpha/beta hydrolase [Gracilibacillus massiliensis]